MDRQDRPTGVELPPEDDPSRVELRRWLDAHPNPTGRQLAEAGYVAPHWPRPWGLDADALLQLAIDHELTAAGVRRPFNPIGIGWAGPTIVHAGSPAQRDRYLLPLLAGEELWCQLFSEPGAGSDLADLSTRAERDGDEYVVNGQKVWSSLAHLAAFGILIARTDPDVPRQRGISYFVVPMDTPGIEVRPLIEMTGEHLFNEVFLTDVRLPVASRVGAENGGWALAKVTLGNERVSLSAPGALWGHGPTFDDLAAVVAGRGGVDGVARQRLAQRHIESRVLQLIRRRTVAAAVRGRPPGPEASIRKILADEHGQALMAAAKDLSGAHGMLTDGGPLGGADGHGWHRGFLFSPALTIGGGTSEVQRNIVAERVLGLPHDPEPDPGRTWRRAHQRPAPPP
jgi:alkylation response protein AidB-like acyl-CoA dehydrogenase